MKEVAKTVASGAVGAVAGGVAVAASGLTALGAVGGGAGIGCALGPAGVVGGAVVGLATWAIVRLFKKES